MSNKDTLPLSGKVIVELDYQIGKDDRTVTLTHEYLTGVLGFEFTTLPLASVQLNSLKFVPPPSQVEGILTDIQDLVKASNQLVGVLKNPAK